LDPGSRQPLSEQLAAGIRRRIERDRLLPGDRLPSVRVLAFELELAPNTVAKAYRILEEDGLLEGRGRHGTFVSDRPRDGSSAAASGLREAANAFVRTAAGLGFGRRDARREIDRAIDRRWGRRT
jgi:DNA-binding transcriptional regulator YhcF (GntR family)